MTISQILDRTFKLVRSHFWLFTGIGAIPAVIFFLVMGAMEAVFMVPFLRHFPKPPDPEALAHQFNPATFALLILIYTVVSLCIFAPYLAAATRAATQADHSISISMSEAWREAFNRAGRYLWLLVLLYAITFLPALLIELATFGGAVLLTVGNANPGVAVFIVIVLGMMLFFVSLVFGILMGLRVSLAFPACVDEGLTATAALKRSNQLSKGAKGRIFVVLLIIYLACYAFTMALFAVLGILGFIFALVGMAFSIPLASPLGYAAIGFVGLCALIGFLLYIALSWAGLTTALAVIYHDQCLRRDAPPPMPRPAGVLA
jgi:hypothetical protein